MIPGRQAGWCRGGKSVDPLTLKARPDDGARQKKGEEVGTKGYREKGKAVDTTAMYDDIAACLPSVR